MADTTRPPSKPDLTPGQPNSAGVSGYCVTPAEGLDTSEVPKVPMHPEEVLALLKARLALGANDPSPTLTAMVPHEAANSSATSCPAGSSVRAKVPSYPDITPSPIVIGISEDEDALRSNVDAAAAACESAEDWREPGAKDTPAEPIASVRVRQASYTDVNANNATANGTNGGENVNPPSGEESIIERLYFPPMKPPESWRDARFDEPLVRVVPDCDAKTRTARSLRRPSSRPAPPAIVETRGWRWGLFLTGSALTVVVLIGILLAPSIRPQNAIVAGEGAPVSSPFDSPSTEPSLVVSRTTSPSSRPDAGTTPTPTANGSLLSPTSSGRKSVQLPSTNARANNSRPSDATRAMPAPSAPTLREDKRPQPQSTGKDGLVF